MAYKIIGAAATNGQNVLLTAEFCGIFAYLSDKTPQNPPAKTKLNRPISHQKDNVRKDPLPSPFLNLKDELCRLFLQRRNLNKEAFQY